MTTNIIDAVERFRVLAKSKPVKIPNTRQRGKVITLADSAFVLTTKRDNSGAMTIQRTKSRNFSGMVNKFMFVNYKETKDL